MNVVVVIGGASSGSERLGEAGSFESCEGADVGLSEGEEITFRVERPWEASDWISSSRCERYEVVAWGRVRCARFAEDCSAIEATAAERLRARLVDRGAAGLTGLDGQYAACIWDRKMRCAYILRDQFSQEPLCYATYAKQLVVGTTTRAVRGLVGRKDVNPEALADYLVFNFPLQPRTFYAGVHSVPPGTVIRWRPDAEPVRVLTDDGLTLSNPPRAAMAELLDTSITRCLSPFAPVACQLSGGIDSSLLVHRLHRITGQKPMTLSLCYDESHPDAVFAPLVAAEVGAEHISIRGHTGVTSASLREMVRELDGPIMAAGVPTWWLVAERARAQGARVLLAGIGADHIFVGARKRRSWPQGHSPDVARLQAFANIEPVVLLRGLGSWIGQVLVGRAEALRACAICDPRIEVVAERFYAQHFLPEHMRMAALAHRRWGVRLENPFLDHALLSAGFAAELRAPSPPGSKAPYRALLRAAGSAAATRADKAQMAMTAIHRHDQLARELVRAVRDPVVPITRKHREALVAKFTHGGQISNSWLRLGWVLLNLKMWVEECGVEVLDVLTLSRAEVLANNRREGHEGSAIRFSRRGSV